MHQHRLSASAQRDRVRNYIRTLRANYDRAYREVSKIFRVRKGCPLEHALRHRRFEAAAELLKLAEKCLVEINHCYALRLAGFRSGDHILVQVTLSGFDRKPTRYIVLDVSWQKGDRYYYEVQELTKKGAPHRGRYPHWLSPSDRVSIEYCTEPLADEAKSLADYRRAASKQLLEGILQKGDLSMFMPRPAPPPPPEQRTYPFWLRRN